MIRARAVDSRGEDSAGLLGPAARKIPKAPCSSIASGREGVSFGTRPHSCPLSDRTSDRRHATAPGAGSRHPGLVGHAGRMHVGHREIGSRWVSMHVSRRSRVGTKPPCSTRPKSGTIRRVAPGRTPLAVHALRAPDALQLAALIWAHERQPEPAQLRQPGRPLARSGLKEGFSFLSSARPALPIAAGLLPETGSRLTRQVQSIQGPSRFSSSQSRSTTNSFTRD